MWLGAAGAGRLCAGVASQAPPVGRSISPLATVLTFISWVALVVGGALCLLNFYLSWLRYPLHRLRRRSKESYHSTSGAPLVGSLLVALSMFGLRSVTAVVPVAIALIVIDTGGIHWLLGSQIYHAWRANSTAANNRWRGP
jgi:hypothetical protein